MSWASTALARLRGLFGQQRLERELDDEVRSHLEMQMDDNVRAGMNDEEARHAALRSFGGVEATKERYRDRRGISLIETTAQDIRYALRTLRKNASFTFTCVTTLALAIGANTAMFSVLHAVLLRPLPYPSPEQLAILWTESPGQNLREARTAFGTVEQWRINSRTFADIAVSDPASVTLTSEDRSERISSNRVSANWFSIHGVQPALGRLFTADEAEKRVRVALLSHRFWQTRFGGSPDALGATLIIDGIPSQVIGVMRADELGDSEIWEPHTAFADWETKRATRGAGSWFATGRLRPGVTIEQAQAEMSSIARRLDEQLPAGARGRGVSVVPLHQHVVGSRSRLALWMLTGAVFCVLLIAATNVASLSLARGAGREREIAIRAALGASRGRIARQLLAENVTMALASGLLGLLIAEAMLRLIVSSQPQDLARLHEVSLNPQVLAWCLGLCLLTGILVGVAPVLMLSRRDLRPAFQEGGRSIAGGAGTRRLRRLFVMAEFALAILLLASAGLLLRSLSSLESTHPGFTSERVIVLAIAAPPLTTEAQRPNLYSRILDQVRSVSGVSSAGFVENIFISSNPERSIITEDGAGAESHRFRFRNDEASGGLFEALGAPLLRGRTFSSEDRPDSPPTAIINDAMARRLWPRRDALGKRFKLGTGDSQSPWLTVVGVVGDMRRQGLEHTPIPQMFQPLTQSAPGRGVLLVRTSMDDPLRIAPAVQEAVRRAERHALIYGVTTLQEQLDRFVAPRRFQTSLLTGFAAVALLMAAIGIYGLIQYSVATRTQEIGIRMAVGAHPGAILRLTVGEGLKLCLIGLLIGLAAALWVGWAGSSLLFGVAAFDPWTFAAVSVLLIVVATAACYFPARRATKIDPVVALRQS
jgi:predicted permease